MKLIFEFELSEPEYVLLLHIAKEGYAEYRDTEFNSVDDFQAPDNCIRKGPKSTTDIQRFLERNTGGTYHLIENLLTFNLIQHVDMAWHTTYELSEFGKLVLTFNKIDFK